MKIVPLEQDEQMTFVEWCHLQGIKCHHSANEVGGSTNEMKRRAVKMKRMGTSKGFPDLLVFVPLKGVYGEVDSYQPLGIEMKRQSGSTTSKEQLLWLEILEMAGIPSRICKGAGEAIEFVQEYML